MKRCINCKNCSQLLDGWICELGKYPNLEIPHPYFMGGPKKCPCYKKNEKVKFEYPKKEQRRDEVE